MADSLDMNNRDPNSLNGHIKVRNCCKIICFKKFQRVTHFDRYKFAFKKQRAEVGYHCVNFHIVTFYRILENCMNVIYQAFTYV